MLLRLALFLLLNLLSNLSCLSFSCFSFNSFSFFAFSSYFLSFSSLSFLDFSRISFSFFCFSSFTSWGWFYLFFTWLGVIFLLLSFASGDLNLVVLYPLGASGIFLGCIGSCIRKGDFNPLSWLVDFWLEIVFSTGFKHIYDLGW